MPTILRLGNKEVVVFELRKFLPSPHDALHPPAWRWLRCQYLLDYEREPSPELDDALTRDAWHFLSEREEGGDDLDHRRLTHRYPAVAAAHQLFMQTVTLKRAEVEARLLARQDDPTIARKGRVPPAVIAAYHDLFFAVRPNLDAPLYIVNMAIGPKAHGWLTLADKDILLKLIGYQMGSLMIDRVLEHFAEPPACPADLSQLDDRALEALREKLLVQTMLLSMILPADAATSVPLASIRQQLEQLGVISKKTTNKANSIQPAIHASLDCQELLLEPVAAVFFPSSPVRAEAASILGEVDSGLFDPDARQAVPA